MALLSPTSDCRTEGGLRTRGFTKRDVVSKPLVTVVTVVFNGAQRIENTIRSVANQTYDNIEYIIIDGGSTDGTLDIVREFAEGIDYWVSERDRGIYDAMNKGINAANGEWINFMNSGDTFCSKESVADTVKEFSEARVYYSDTIFYFEQGANCYCRKVSCDVRKYQFIHQSCIYRKQLHSIYGQYMVAAGVTVSDYLFFRCIPAEDWHKTKTVISRYLVGDNVSSGRRHKEQVYGTSLLLGSRSIYGAFASYLYGSLRSGVRRIEKFVLGANRYSMIFENYLEVDRKKFWQDIIGDVEQGPATVQPTTGEVGK